VDADRLHEARPVRRAIVALTATALLAFALVGTAAMIVARHIAEDQALAESLRTATSVAGVLFAPAMPAVLAGDHEARAKLDRAVRARGRQGAIVRVKVWDRDDVVVYSDDPEADGEQFPGHPDVLRVFEDGGGVAHLSEREDVENATEAALDRLVEAYVPMPLDDGRDLVLEIYSSTVRVEEARAQLVARLVPAALIGLLVLVVAQLPVAVWLIRRIGRSQEERGRLLRSALTASDRERRSIARDLHDGVVQELSGASYALGALDGPHATDVPDRVRRMVREVSTVVGAAVSGLRTLMVEIYPPELTRAALNAALEDLADPLRATGVQVSVRAELDAEIAPEVAATVYRGARECLVNVAKHAGATHAWVELTGDSAAVRLRVADDGVGMSPEPAPRAGHLGLQLLRAAVTELSGTVRIGPGPGGGTEVVLDLPSTPVPR
jgi:two-component system NarL family sensor kinase